MTVDEQSSPHALVWVSDETDRCIAFNESWLQWRGRSLADESVQGWCDALVPDDREPVHDVHLRHLGSRSPYAVECRMTRPDGSAGQALAGAAPWFHSDGRMAGFVGACLDISDGPPLRGGAPRIEAFYRATVNALDQGVHRRAAIGTAQGTWTPLVGTSCGAGLLRVAHFVDAHGLDAFAHQPRQDHSVLTHGMRARIAGAERRGERLALVRFIATPVATARDRYGQTHSDDLLQVLLGRLTQTVRGNDIVGQIDDRTIAVLLDGVDTLTTAQAVAETIRASVCQPVRLEGEGFWPEVRLDVSLVGTSSAGRPQGADAPSVPA